MHPEIFERYRVNDYWTTHPSEWAIDLRFRRAEDFRRLFPLLVPHGGITTFGSPDVLRFLGRKVPRGGPLRGNYEGEVFSGLKRRQEGMRIQHSIEGNSLKAYDKADTEGGSIFRSAELTINNVEPLRVYRPREGDPDGPLTWRPMRRGVADLHPARRDRFPAAL